MEYRVIYLYVHKICPDQIRVTFLSPLVLVKLGIFVKIG